MTESKPGMSIEDMFKQFVDAHCSIQTNAWVQAEILHSAFQDYCFDHKLYHSHMSLDKTIEIAQLIYNADRRGYLSSCVIVGIHLDTYPRALPAHIVELRDKVKKLQNIETNEYYDKKLDAMRLFKPIPEDVMSQIPENAKHDFYDIIESMLGAGTPYNPLQVCTLIDVFINYHGHQLNAKVTQFLSDHIQVDKE